MPCSKNIGKTFKAANGIKSVILKVAIASIVNVILFLVLTFAVAQFILTNPIEPKKYKIIMCMILAFSSFTGGFLSSKPIKKNGMLMGLFSSFLLLIILTVWVMIFCPDILNYMFPVSLLITALSASFGGIAGVNLKGIRK